MTFKMELDDSEGSRNEELTKAADEKVVSAHTEGREKWGSNII